MTKRSIPGAASLALLLGAVPASALLGAVPASALLGAVPASARVDVPVRQTVLTDGQTRYSVPVTVGDGPPIEAMLDTGSFGLRVLATALRPGQSEATDLHRRYPFGGGVRFDGVLARAALSVGGARTAAPELFQRIDRVGCAESKPGCPAATVGAADYRIAGDGLPGEGFPAILGLAMRRAPGKDYAPNPLTVTGDRSWIVVLPRPGSAEPGHLIVDPDAADRAGFALLQLDPQPGAADDEPPGWADAALPGCLFWHGRRDWYCGRTALDTGAPGFAVAASDVEQPKTWSDGRPVSFEIGGSGGPVSIAFAAEDSPAARVLLHPPHGQGPEISAGTLPYFDYAVLYDAKAGTIGFRKRD